MNYNGNRYYGGEPRNDSRYQGHYNPRYQEHLSSHYPHADVYYGGRQNPEMDVAKTFDHEPFRHIDPKYKCLCNKMHVKKGCKFILAFLVAIVILGIGFLVLNWNIGTWTTVILHTILLLGIILCAFALFLAMKTEKENLLLPVAGIAVIGAIISIIFFFFALWSLIDPSGATGKLVNNFVVSQNASQTDDFGLDDNRGEIQTVSAVSMVLSLVGLAASIWVAFVVFKYYIYLKDMKAARVPRNQVHIEITDMNKKIHQ